MSEYVMKQQVQERLSVSHDTLDKLIANGEITAVKIGRAVRVDLDSVEAYLAKHTMSKGKSTGETIA